jgi:hypothetical protein
MRRALIGLGYAPELFTNTTLKEVPRVEMYGLSPRQLLISLNNWGRSIDQRFWIDRIIADAPFGVAGWIIGSVGTQDEVACVRMSLGAPIIRLERTGAEARPDGRILVEPDAKITNDGDPADAAAAVVSFAQAWSLAA